MNNQATDIKVLSTPIPIVCMTFTSGKMDIAVYINHSNSIKNELENNSSLSTSSSTSTLCLYETIDLGLNDHINNSNSYLSNTLNKYTSINIMNDPHESDTIYISHMKGCHRIRFAPWIHQLINFLSSACDQNDLYHFLKNHISSSVQTLVNTSPIDSG